MLQILYIDLVGLTSQKPVEPLRCRCRHKSLACHCGDSSAIKLKYFLNMVLVPFNTFTSKPSRSIINQSTLYSIAKAVSRSMLPVSIVQSTLAVSEAIPHTIGMTDNPYDRFLFESPTVFLMSKTLSNWFNLILLSNISEVFGCGVNAITLLTLLAGYIVRTPMYAPKSTTTLLSFLLLYQELLLHRVSRTPDSIAISVNMIGLINNLQPS
jgi:hypothetical protein